MSSVFSLKFISNSPPSFSLIDGTGIGPPASRVKALVLTPYIML
jgi:hypothetical protein